MMSEIYLTTNQILLMNLVLKFKDHVILLGNLYKINNFLKMQNIENRTVLNSVTDILFYKGYIKKSIFGFTGLDIKMKLLELLFGVMLDI